MAREIRHQLGEDDENGKADFIAIGSELLSQQECRECNESFPLTDEYFYRDNRARTGFRNICKSCLQQKEEDKRDKEIERRVGHMDIKMLETLERLAEQDDKSVPHLAKLVEVGMHCYGGLTAFMQQMYANRLAAKPGSKERLQYDMIMVRAITELFRKDTVKIPVDLMSDEDIEKEIEKRTKGMLRIADSTRPPDSKAM